MRRFLNGCSFTLFLKNMFPFGLPYWRFTSTPDEFMRCMIQVPPRHVEEDLRLTQVVARHTFHTLALASNFVDT